MDPAQAGFTPARSCDDVTFAIRRIIEDYIRAPANPLSEFYDVEDDNDLYILLELAPAVQKHTGGSFTPKVGLQQGGVMSPTLWNLYLNCVIQAWRSRLGKGHWGVPVTHCRDGRLRTATQMRGKQEKFLTRILDMES